MTNDIAVLLITDGRRAEDGTPRALNALRSVLHRPLLDHVAELVVVNDSLDETFARDLTREVGPGNVVAAALTGNRKVGFDGAIRSGWRRLLDVHRKKRLRYVVHLEDDFLVDDPGDFLIGRQLLARHPDVCQVALKRNPVNRRELDAGGMLEAYPPNSFLEVCESTDVGPVWWSCHELYFTTNPSIYPFELVTYGWPRAPRSEERFSDLMRQYRRRSAYLGKVTDPPRCQHVAARSTDGEGY